ncbi:MAG: hypothetical protein ACRDEA_06430, partial [Microcystaceae cyanobacterium]
MWITSSIANALTPNAIALGNFDGIHQGHRQVLHPILTAASAIEFALPTSEKGISKEANHLYA